MLFIFLFMSSWVWELAFRQGRDFPLTRSPSPAEPSLGPLPPARPSSQGTRSGPDSGL